MRYSKYTKPELPLEKQWALTEVEIAKKEAEIQNLIMKWGIAIHESDLTYKDENGKFQIDLNLGKKLNNHIELYRLAIDSNSLITNNSEKIIKIYSRYAELKGLDFPRINDSNHYPLYEFIRSIFTNLKNEMGLDVTEEYLLKDIQFSRANLKLIIPELFRVQEMEFTELGMLNLFGRFSVKDDNRIFDTISLFLRNSYERSLIGQFSLTTDCKPKGIFSSYFMRIAGELKGKSYDMRGINEEFETSTYNYYHPINRCSVIVRLLANINTIDLEKLEILQYGRERDYLYFD